MKKTQPKPDTRPARKTLQFVPRQGGTQRHRAAPTPAPVKKEADTDGKTG